VTRYRIHLESRQLAPGTINGRLAAVRRLAYEAADAGLLSPDLAAGIRRVKGPKNLGVRLGNWLTTDQARGDGCGAGTMKARFVMLRTRFKLRQGERSFGIPILRIQ
jgi:hypothetical protein